MPNPTSIQPGGPMVTVKKADGTMVKVPLSEIRNIRTQKQPTKSDRPPQTLAEGLERLLAERRRINQDAMIANMRTTKNTPPKADAPVAQKLRNKEMKATPNLPRRQAGAERRTPNANWRPGDHKSLLDDEFHKENLPMVIEARQKALAKVRPVFALQAEFTRRRDGPGKPVSVATGGATPGKPMTDMRTTKNTRPTSLRRSRCGRAKLRNEGMETGNLKLETWTPPAVVRSPSSVVKPILHDVRPPMGETAKRSLGPVDELRSFTLSDLRHLDVTPQAAGSKLGQKFETLKDESYLLYMEGVKAWRESPLYRAYQAVLLKALNNRQAVSQILGASQDREAMRMEEWGVVVNVNQNLL